MSYDPRLHRLPRCLHLHLRRLEALKTWGPLQPMPLLVPQPEILRPAEHINLVTYSNLAGPVLPSRLQQNNP